MRARSPSGVMKPTFPVARIDGRGVGADVVLEPPPLHPERSAVRAAAAAMANQRREWAGRRKLTAYPAENKAGGTGDDNRDTKAGYHIEDGRRAAAVAALIGRLGLRRRGQRCLARTQGAQLESNDAGTLGAIGLRVDH